MDCVYQRLIDAWLCKDEQQQIRDLLQFLGEQQLPLIAGDRVNNAVNIAVPGQRIHKLNAMPLPVQTGQANRPAARLPVRTLRSPCNPLLLTRHIRLPALA